MGQFIKRKGFDVLLKSLPLIDLNIGVYIIGGQETEEYKKIIEERNLNHVYFLPFMPSAELEIYYKAADLFVLPTREDVWGLVVNEAMSNMLPVITTDKCVAGFEMISDCDSGVLIESENSKELAFWIDKIIKDKDMREYMSVNAYIQSWNYTIEKMVDRHVEILGYNG